MSENTYKSLEIKTGSKNVSKILLGRGHVATTIDGKTGYDIGSDEVWDTYLGSTHLYHKDKTFENYFKAHKLVYTTWEGNGSTYYHKDNVLDTKGLESELSGKNIIIRPITDLDDYMCKVWEETDEAGKTTKYLTGLTFHIKPINQEEFWTPIKEWLANHFIPADYLQTHHYNSSTYYRIGRFGNSNIYGEVTLCLEKVNYCAWYYPFKNCSQITKLNIKCKDTTDNIGLTSMNSCFCGLSGCTELTYDGKPNTPSDVSDCFSDVKFTTWPRNLLTYGSIKTSNYMIDGGNIKVIPLCSYSDDRFHDYNQIEAQRQTFNCQWTDIMPMCRCNKGELDYKSFGYNTAGKNVRIYGINQSYSFDDKKSALGDYYSYLPNLDAESIQYLFENLTDLTTYDAELATSNGNINSFDSWWISGSSSKVTKSHAVAATSANGSIIACNSFGKTGTIKIAVSGIVGGTLTCYHGGTLLATITEDGDYDIEVTSATNNWIQFQLSGNTSFTNPVKITLRKPYTATAAKSSTFDLYVPSKWETTFDAVDGNDFDTLITNAKAKGWKIYVGDTLRE